MDSSQNQNVDVCGSAPPAAQADAPSGPLPVPDLRAQLISAADDLRRLQALLSDACDTLLARFSDAAGHARELGAIAAAASSAQALQEQLAGAVIALQFQDMAHQLIDHTHGHLHRCADVLHLAPADTTAMDPAPPVRSSPVAQHAMNVGSVDLF
jgi:hypothetical protein